jgi:hypothetical protein
MWSKGQSRVTPHIQLLHRREARQTCQEIGGTVGADSVVTGDEERERSRGYQGREERAR